MNRFLIYLIFQFLTVPMILAIFRNIHDRKVAALMATSVFLAMTLGSFYWEKRKAQFQHKIFWITGLQFFIFFVLPIFLLRVLFWDQNFMEIEFLGIKPATLHGYSNSSFSIWMIGTGIEAVQLILKAYGRK